MFDALLPLTDTQRDIQQLARDFAAEHVAPFAAQWDRDQHFEPALVPQLAEAGFLGMLISKEHGGLGFSPQAQSIILGRIASRSPDVCTIVMVPNSLGPGELIRRMGEQQT